MATATSTEAGKSPALQILVSCPARQVETFERFDVELPPSVDRPCPPPEVETLPSPRPYRLRSHVVMVVGLADLDTFEPALAHALCKGVAKGDLMRLVAYGYDRSPYYVFEDFTEFLTDEYVVATLKTLREIRAIDKAEAEAAVASAPEFKGHLRHPYWCMPSAIGFALALVEKHPPFAQTTREGASRIFVLFAGVDPETVESPSVFASLVGFAREAVHLEVGLLGYGLSADERALMDTMISKCKEAVSLYRCAKGGGKEPPPRRGDQCAQRPE